MSEERALAKAWAFGVHGLATRMNLIAADKAELQAENKALRAKVERLRRLLEAGVEILESMRLGGELPEAKIALKMWWVKSRAELESPDEQAVQAGHDLVDERVRPGPTTD